MDSSTLRLAGLIGSYMAGEIKSCREHAGQENEGAEKQSNIYADSLAISGAVSDEVVCGCYSNSNIVKGMPKSIFADRFGYDMQDEIWAHMNDFYAGRISQAEINDYFEECCSSMRIYRTQQCQTSGNNQDDNKQIIGQVYEMFAKNNQRAAMEANYLEGKAVNQSYGSGRRDDWVYYNADYHYKCEAVKMELRQDAEAMTAKWETASIDAQEIENNSIYKVDGAFDFNSGWNFVFRDQVGRSSLAKESLLPPKDFKLFYKENIYSEQRDIEKTLYGKLWIMLGKSEYVMDVPFKASHPGLEGEIFNVGKLIHSYDDKTKYINISGYEDFLDNFSVFTRWYSWVKSMER